MEITEFARCAAPTSGRRTAIEALLRCDANELSLADMPGFEARLRARFPDIGALRSIGHEGTTSIADAAALCGTEPADCRRLPVTFSRSTQTVEHEVFQVVVEYTEEAVGRLAFAGRGAVLRRSR